MNLRRAATTLMIFTLLSSPMFAQEPATDWQTLYNAAWEAQQKRQHARSRKLFRQALETARPFGPDDPRYVKTLRRLAERHRLDLRPVKAHSLLADERAYFEQEVGPGPRLVPLLLVQSDEHRFASRAKQAEEILLYALSLAEPREEFPHAARQVLERLAVLCEQSDRPMAAIEYMEQLREISDASFAASVASHTLARLYAETGKLDQAAAAYGALYEAILSRRSDGDRFTVMVRQEYAALLRRMGKESEAQWLLRPRREEPLDETLEHPHPDEILVSGQDGVSSPRIVRRISPEYPQKARVKRVGGKVILQAVVGRDGRVWSAEVLRSDRPGYGFEEEAERCVKQWRYEPATYDGVPVPVYVTVVVDYTLN